MKTENKDKFRYTDVTLVAFGHFVHDIYTAFLAPMLPYLIEKLSLSYSAASLLKVAQQAPSLLNPFIGLLAEKVSLRYFVILSPLISAILMSLLGLAPNYGILLIMLLFTGLSSAMFHVPAPVMVRKVSGKRIGKGMSFFMLGGELARSTGPLVIVAAASVWTFEGTWRLIFFAAIASFLMFLRFRKLKISDDIEKVKHEESAWAELKKYKRFFFGISGFILFMSFVKASLSLFLPVFFKEAGQSLFMGGAALSIYQIAGAAGTFLAGSVSDKIGRHRTLLIIALVSPVLMMLFGFFYMKSFVFVILILLGFFAISSTPVILAYVQDLDSKRSSFFNGIYMTLGFGISTFSTLLTGFASDLLGLVTTFRLAAVLGLGAIPFALYLSRFKNNQQGK